LLESATGSGTLSLSGVTINGFDSSAFPEFLKLADGIEGELSESALRPGIEQAAMNQVTEVDRLEIPFNIAGGRLRAANIAGQNNAISFSGDADIGLLGGDLAAKLTVAFKPGEDALAGADPSVSLDWQGPLAAPDRKIDITALNSLLSLRRFEQERRRVEIMQANIAEKQRLRREAALYRSLDAERERLEQRARDNDRLLKAAQEALKAKARADEAARLKAKAEADKRKADEAKPDDQDGDGVKKLNLSPETINQ
jgi:hypothetical protein